MTFNPDDPKWTAYILGELEASERAEMDNLLESSEEARAYLEELRDAAGALEHELKSELNAGFPPVINAQQSAGLTEAQRATITAAAETSPITNLRWFRRPQVWAAGLAAAMVLIAVAVPSLWHSSQTGGGQESVIATNSSKSEEVIPASPAISTEGRTKTPDSPESTIVREYGIPPSSNNSASKAGPSPVNGSSDPISPQGAPGAAAGPAPSVPGAIETPNSARDSASEPVQPSFARSLQLNGNAVVPSVPPGRGGGGGGGGRGGGAAFSGLAGTITDSSGAFIPGVTVTATNIATGVVTTVLSNDAGAYNFPNLQPGSYFLTARLQGFQTASLTDINLGTAETQRFKITLSIAPSSTMASVSVAQSSSTIGAPLSERQVKDLPMVGNNVIDMIGKLGAAEKSEVAGLQSQPQQGQTPNPRGTAGAGGGGRGGGAGGGAGVGPGRVGGVAGGVAGGRVNAAGAAPSPPPPAAAAPPPPPPGGPPPAPSASPVRTLPDNPTVLGGFNYYDRPATLGTASYASIVDNPFIRVEQDQLSTFSSDVDTASYANLRRFLNQNQLPPRDAVRIEEMINYFSYDYPQPSGRDPIGAQMEVASAPWNPSHRLVRIGIKARDIDTRRRPASNLVFLIDVSGSMQPPERLPLIKSGLKMLVNNLTENDHVSMVVYAGASGVALPSTSGDRKDVINRAIDNLQAGGSTNGASGIQLAYQLATANFIAGGVNRVILATDGDFNVGVTNQNELTRLIQDRARSGVFLSVLGVGTDNLKDSTMERLADNGNGNYAYLDSLNEAYKVLVQQMGGTLVTVAKDVKLQVEFNPAFVEAYRLIGYENRVLANVDFNNDRKDAGDMGAGHTVTALYEIVPRGGSIPGPGVDPLKYQTPAQAPVPRVQNGSNETLTLKIRYKDPNGTESKLMSLPLVDREGSFSRASVDFRFAASVAEFGMILRDSPYRGNASIGEVLDNAQASRGSDRNGYRQEFIGLVQRARSMR